MIYLFRCPVIGSKDEYQDFDVESNKVVLGAGTNATIYLTRLEGGQITFKASDKDRVQFQCNKYIQLHTGDEVLTKGDLVIGTVYQLGVYDLELIQPPSGFDIAIQLRLSSRKNTQTNVYKQLIEPNAKFKFRSFSYLLFITILLIYLVVPYLTKENRLIKSRLSSVNLPTDKSWSSGPLAMAHHVPEIGDNCNSCHTVPFQTVQDQQCLSCHKNIGDHVSADHPTFDKFQGLKCENCHKEHNEPARITRTDDQLCIQCHEKIESFESDSDLAIENVNGFTPDSHPLFRLSLVKPLGNGASLGWEKVRPKYNPSIVVNESSNLKFSHQIHLDVEKVQNPTDSKELTCQSCHQLKQDGKQFIQITMDKDCRSCHQLTFDVFNPDLELPHGDLRSATVALEAHYIREFTDPELRQLRAKKKPRRIPGKHMSQAVCEGSGLDCGRKEALAEAEFQFTKTGCITCHNVSSNKTNELHSNWFVQPIKLNNDWYVKSDFDHKSHLSIRNDDAKGICLSCHQADKSDLATDILIPQQETCLECHQQDVLTSVRLKCAQCHNFHISENINKAL